MSTDEVGVTLASLYIRWEKEFWRAHDLSLDRDKLDWINLSDDERRQWYWIAGFSHFRETEPHAVAVLTKLLPLLRSPQQQGVLALQIADECRHAFFFERFHEEVVMAAAPAPDQSQRGISPAYQYFTFDGVTASVNRATEEPDNANLAAAIFHVFIMLEGSLALASFSIIRLLLSKLELFPGLLAGVTKAHQDEVRHTQLGILLLQDLLERDMGVREAMVAKLKDLMPAFSEVLRPRPERDALLTSLGFKPGERRQRAFAHLNRHLRILGIDAELIRPWTAVPTLSNGQDGPAICERRSA
jgi:ribonucleotide reductase beta subunit family protein with ferritin-like domain